jgi:hypothetical protein
MGEGGVTTLWGRKTSVANSWQMISAMSTEKFGALAKNFSRKHYLCIEAVHKRLLPQNCSKKLNTAVD